MKFENKASINIEKSKIREIYLKKRSLQNSDQVKASSELVCKNFIKFFEKNFLFKIQRPKIFSLYIAINNEISPLKISQFFENHNIEFCYPKIIEKSQELQFILFDKNQALKNNQVFKKIIEPESGKIVKPDFIITPLLAFDEKLNRLGMGKGFYDRTIFELKKQNPNLITAGLAFDFQHSTKDLPCEKNDEKLDFIFTENFIFQSK